MSARNARFRQSSPKPRKLSRTHAPEGMTLRQWQLELRRQFGAEQPFRIQKLGPEPVFAEYAVANPATRRTYRVVIRGEEPGRNYCSCPDYAVNTLGTCKHIEATLHRLRRKHAHILRRGFRPPFAEVYVRYGNRRDILFSEGTSCPPALRRLASLCFDSTGCLRPDRFGQFDAFARGAARFGDAIRIYDDAWSLVAEVRDAERRRRRLREKYGGRNGEWNRLLAVPLYPYQREGALFAATAGRAIIADEMGLGKTIQAIAAAEILARECGLERVLVVCPASLKSQWLDEIGRFCRRPALIIEGLTHSRAELYARGGVFFKIVNYDVVHRDLDAIARWSPELVILDEAQRIKNWQTRAAQTVKRIESPYAFVLTGTPLENRLEELHSIVEFVDRHRLGPLFAFKADHAVYEEGTTKVIGYRDLGKITKTLAPILIRRSKSQVLTQLPARMDKNFFVPMTEQQWVPHAENREIVARIVAKWRRYRFLSDEDQLRLRIALQNMRMSCDSTYLIDHQTKHHTKIGELANVLSEIFEEDGAKVVIFSQWVRMNELVAEMLEERGWGHVHLHGGVPSRERKDLTRALREDDKCRVFLSTDAGGVGLNLQRASAVINMDLPWNPAVLEQRIGRVHRMGQQRAVRVVNFVSEHTIEHGMLSLLAFKQSVFSGVLDGTTDKVLMGESAMSRFMKTVEAATTAVPAAPPPSETGRPEAGTSRAPAAKDSGEPARSPEAGLNALRDLVTQGAAWLQQLGEVLSVSSGRADEGASAKAGAPARVVRDSSTGRQELRIALPEPGVMAKWVDVIRGLLHRPTA